MGEGDGVVCTERFRVILAGDTGDESNHHWFTIARAHALRGAAGILSYQLFIPPIIGLNNKGDSITILRALYLEVPDESDPERFFIYIVPLWVPHPEPLYDNGLASSETILLSGKTDSGWMAFARPGYFGKFVKNRRYPRRHYARLRSGQRVEDTIAERPPLRGFAGEKCQHDSALWKVKN